MSEPPEKKRPRGRPFGRRALPEAEVLQVVEFIRRVGPLLYAKDNWQASLAQALGIPVRLLQYWLVGKWHPGPSNPPSELMERLQTVYRKQARCKQRDLDALHAAFREASEGEHGPATGE